MNKTETGRGWIIHLKSPAEEWQSTDTPMEFAFHFVSFFFFTLKKFIYFLIGGYLLYKIMLVSAIQQHESAIGIHVPPSLLKLPPIALPIPPL